MLVLTRKRGEAVVIGDDVVVRVLEVTGDAVRLGIDAPRAIGVLREEIWLATQANRDAAAAPAPDQLPDMGPARGSSNAAALTPPTAPPKKSP